MKKNKKDNIISVIAITLIILAVIGVIKCDSYRVEKHLNKCKEICKPDQIVEILSKKRCVCQEKKKEEEIINIE